MRASAVPAGTAMARNKYKFSQLATCASIIGLSCEARGRRFVGARLIRVPRPHSWL